MFQRWPKRDTDKGYFKMPNEVFCLGLDSKEISIYAYLHRCEDRDTYQCHPSYEERRQRWIKDGFGGNGEKTSEMKRIDREMSRRSAKKGKRPQA